MNSPIKLALAMLPLSVSALYGADSGDSHPNIILINIDDLGWGDLGYMGSTYYQTPNIDRLHARAVSFTNGYAASANSAPSRACMLTGLYTPRHGVYTVNLPDRGESRDRRVIPAENNRVLPEGSVTLPMVLQEAGYATCHIGKWHVGEDPLKQGIDVNIAGNKQGHPKSYFSPYKNENLEDGPEGEYLVERLASEAVSYIDNASGDRPFFLYYAPYAVHSPWVAKEDMVESYKRRSDKASDAHFNPTYAAMVESMDRAVGDILEAVERSGESKNTLIIFVSDNGGVYKVSRQWPLRAGKGSFYEGGIRIPYMIYMDGRFEGGREYDVPVSNIDIFPTLLDLAGIDYKAELDGESLLPLLSNNQSGTLEKRDLFWFFPAYLEGGEADAEAKDLIFRTRPVSVIRHGDWKLIENFEDGTLELYNLKDDISERSDLSEKMPKVVKQLYRRMQRWQQQTGAPVNFAPNPDYSI